MASALKKSGWVPIDKQENWWTKYNSDTAYNTERAYKIMLKQKMIEG